MIRKVRQCCFESDSSSQHVIVVTNNDTHVTTESLRYNEHNRYNFEAVHLGDDNRMWLWDVGNGYGRCFEILTTFDDKLQYAMCEYLGYMYGDDPEFDTIYDMFLDIVREILPEVTDFGISTKEVYIYKDENGQEILHKNLRYSHGEYDADGTWKSHFMYKSKDGTEKEAILDTEYCYEMPDIGMIDHQSSGMLKRFLTSHQISLKEFLTNRKYVVVVDSDERCGWQKIKESGLFNFAATILEEYM